MAVALLLVQVRGGPVYIVEDQNGGDYVLKTCTRLGTDPLPLSLNTGSVSLARPNAAGLLWHQLHFSRYISALRAA